MMINTPEDKEVIDLLNEYDYIVRRIARSACYSSASIELNDFYQIGNMAVLQAIKAYDPTCGTTIKSFVTKVVRNAIFREAARFLGVFTVDHRVTGLAAKVNRMHAKGINDQEIADILNASTSRNFDIEHIRDLRIAYDRRQHSDLNNDEINDEHNVEENTIKEFLQDITRDEIEVIIINERILGDESIRDVSKDLGITQKLLYEMENRLKERIKLAIEGLNE